MMREPVQDLQPFVPDQIAEARRLAPTRNLSVVATLEELAGDAPEVFTARLGR